MTADGKVVLAVVVGAVRAEGGAALVAILQVQRGKVR